ncbi:aspartate dehydrogenase domain-containing protein-like isoform X2 [Paramacrobiotus metropolitanus]|uniref:aspartate dehydrogenase domain-containing protein-like isoform X2 n=1 Tax=Paramacrobiotus metropolitanus TaxID=2943436 RepID=UPI0024456C5D|nr:aspartate dehydrogenase domain-containing protein-like isoform X2 [Paramacrobiotus metropolitanus]
MVKRRIGLVGYGHVGQHLHNFILRQSNLELVFIWNRTRDVLVNAEIPETLILDDLDNVGSRKCDLIVEVAHPDITKKYGAEFLKHADYMIGSPTALADEDLEYSLRELANEGKHGLYVPVGALWGAEDIRRMANAGILQALTITMTKHPSAFRLSGKLNELNEEAASTSRPVTLYEGGIRALCRLAPNNVNTMAAAALAAHNLGFDKVQGKLVSDPKELGWHIITIEVLGSPQPNGTQLSIRTERRNPADVGAVTGSATYASFANSLLAAYGRGAGFHVC